MKPSEVLQKLKHEQLYRSLNPLPNSGAKISNPSQLNFCSNDYLNLSGHPLLKEAAIRAIERYGTSASSSRLLSGHLDLHEELEAKLAEWSGYPAALSFGSGYLCNIGVLQAILDSDAFVLFDRLNHASLIDGLRLAQITKKPQATKGPGANGISWQRYKHLDMQNLERKLEAVRQRSPQRPIWIVTESVFSMDGDIAPLQEIGRLAHKYSAFWLLDEAHSLGIFGPRGAGLTQALRAADSKVPDIVSANFAKALGSYGGFCLCSIEQKEFLINFSRSLIYSTALPPASAAAALAAIKVIEEACNTENVGTLQTRLWKIPQSPALANFTNFTSGLGFELLQRTENFYAELSGLLRQDLLPLSSPIIPLILGDNQTALSVAEQMRAQNFYVKAIRTPTVPPNTARLRFSLTLGHTAQDLSDTARALSSILKGSSRTVGNEIEENHGKKL